MNVRGWRGVRRDTAAFNGALRVRAKRGMLRSVEPLGGSDAHADRRELRQEELAAILWALGSCLYRRFSWRSPFWVQTFWQLAVSIVPVGGDCAN